MKILISKDEVDALIATNPNDFIFSSDNNTFKIIDHGILTNQAISADPTTLLKSHSISGIPVCFAFIKYPDGKIYLPGSVQPLTDNTIFRYWEVEVNSNNLYFLVHKKLGANFNVDIAYYVFEAPISGNSASVSGGQVLRVSKPTKDALSPSSEDDLIYNSQRNTLKYFVEGSKSLTIAPGATLASTSVTHGLGYYPFFITYLELNFSLGAGKYCQVPYNFSFFGGYVTITSSVDKDKIYFQASNAGSTFGAMTLNFTYKIFLNDIGL
jgi:hypothetical protein